MLVRIILIALLLCLVMTVPAAAQEPPPDDDSWLPDFPDPGEITQTIIGLLLEFIIDTLKGWFDDMIAQAREWVSDQWSLSSDTGLGGIMRLIYSISRGLALSLIGLALSMTFFQMWLVRLFPGLVRTFTLGQTFGRMIVAALFLSNMGLDFLIGLLEMTDEMAFSLIINNGGGMGFMAEWSWLSNMTDLLAQGYTAFSLTVFAALALIIVLTLVLMVTMVIKQLLIVLILGALPLAAAAWLFPLTDGLWGKYWWMFLKICALPFLLAFTIRLIITALAIVGESFIVGVILALLVQFAALWLLFKFLMMPETWMVGIGAALTLTGAGASAGVPMMIGGASGYAKRAGLGDETQRVKQTYHDASQIASQIDQ